MPRELGYPEPMLVCVSLGLRVAYINLRPFICTYTVLLIPIYPLPLTTHDQTTLTYQFLTSNAHAMGGDGVDQWAMTTTRILIAILAWVLFPISFASLVGVTVVYLVFERDWFTLSMAKDAFLEVYFLKEQDL